MTHTRIPSHPPGVSGKSGVTRRDWLKTAAVQSSALVALTPWSARMDSLHEGHTRKKALPRPARATSQAEAASQTPVAQLEALAQRAVEAARAAGARYADARLTRTVHHEYLVGGGFLTEDVELVGVGVRALVNGYWGFTAAPLWVGEPDKEDTVVRLARAAVAQAQVNAKGPPRTVELSPVPAVTGTWATPVTIDPFHISIEEKQDTLRYWAACVQRAGLRIAGAARIGFGRQERVVATSDGSHFTQTCYESGGVIVLGLEDGSPTRLPIQGIDWVGKGWELFLDAHIPEQIAAMPEKLLASVHVQGNWRRSTVGRYTVVCDGTTMASLLEHTVGVATQLDRALGYEANAGGTSFLDDPLAMLGQHRVASSLVTVTGNRSAPAQLATVKWDDEGVTPREFTLVKDGVLADFQTTREQAAWLAPYYTKAGRPVQSNGCAAAQDASYITLQHMPNLALAPSPHTIGVNDLVASIQDGILLEYGSVTEMDAQARNGLLDGRMREIKNGKPGRFLIGGSVLFNTEDLWKHVTALGGASTTAVVASSPFDHFMAQMRVSDNLGRYWPHQYKGQPAQGTSHSVQAVAATITSQPLIDAARKA